MPKLSNSEDAVAALLKEHGMKLVRNKKHQCWRHPSGRLFVMSSTPSDSYAANQQLRSLKKFLGIERPVKEQKLEEKVVLVVEKAAREKTANSFTIEGTGALAGHDWKSQLRSVKKDLEKP